MDRVGFEIEDGNHAGVGVSQPHTGHEGGSDMESLAKGYNSVPAKLLELGELDVLYEPDQQTLWTYISPDGRPSFTPSLLSDFESWQHLIGENFGTDKVPLRFLVLGSRAPGVFCYGGDLALFRQLIIDRNQAGLVDYGRRCCAILHRNLNTLGIPMLTVGMVEGAALGGGFEALLSFDYIIAEQSATFGLPEIMFGLFPGMGAHAFLYRKLGSAMADRLIVSNQTYTAAEMYDMGLVDEVVPDGEALQATQAFIKRSTRKHTGLVASRKALKIAKAITLEELNEITELWAETAMQLSDKDLKLMDRLVRAQRRGAQKAA